jgi:hypothetical protein
MKNCPQTDSQSVYEHGISVRDHIFQLIAMLKENKTLGNWRLPDWFFTYREQLLAHLLPEDIIEEYTIHHDCGKPYCLTLDSEGKRHFYNHAETSYQTWLSVGGSEQAANLMKMDMLVHQMKANDIDEFIKHPEAITLLLAGLAEVHSNGAMFGGFDSTSFKIKWNQINKRGKAICLKLFGESHVSID